MLEKVLKDPLLHFLVLGLGLFVLYAALNPASEANDPRHIVVDREALLTFSQFRAKSFEPAQASARLARLSADQLKDLINEYVREEVLYREARALGLEQNDYVIKRRMIQKIDFINQGFARTDTVVSAQDLQAYYSANKERYRVPEAITFTHVFFSSERHGRDQALALARKKIAELRAKAVHFTDAPKHGERFPYGLNYVDRPRRHVVGQFGEAMTASLFELEPDDNDWHGPYLSALGAHLVMVVANKPARYPDLEMVRERIEADFKSDRIKTQTQQAVQEIIEGYRVDIRLDEFDAKALSARKVR